MFLFIVAVVFVALILLSAYAPRHPALAFAGMVAVAAIGADLILRISV